MDKPDFQKVLQVIPEAENMEEIASGGFKVVYKAKINNKIEAVKLVLIPGDANDPSIRDENMRRIKREIDLIAKCSSPCLIKLGSIKPRECKIEDKDYLIYSVGPGTSLSY